jgi:tetratricopeptide (TPR) repeat protein
MDTNKPKPNEHLKQQRLLRGWTQECVADELHTLSRSRSGTRGDINAQMISRWELGKHPPSLFWQGMLYKLYEKTTEELGFVDELKTSQPTHSNQVPSLHVLTGEQATYVLKQHERSLQVSGSDDMDKKRRELLHLLSVAGAALFLPFPDLDWEKIEGALVKPSHLDEQVLGDLENICTYYWSLYKASSSKRIVLDGVLGQLKTFTGLLKDSHPTSLHTRLCALACDLSQLAGEIFFDSNEYDSAQSCYLFAASAAKEAKNYDLWACALVRHAFIAIYSGQPYDALPLLQGAEKLAHRGDAALTTRYWVAAVSAQAYAGTGNLAACQKFLDLAEDARDLEEVIDRGWLRFDGSRLPEERGACFVKLQEPELAFPALQKALKQYPTPTRRRGMVLTDLATASLQQGNIDQACFYANEVVDIAHQRPSGILKKGMHGLRTQLEPFSQTDTVKKLDQRITSIV